MHKHFTYQLLLEEKVIRNRRPQETDSIVTWYGDRMRARENEKTQESEGLGWIRGLKGQEQDNGNLFLVV